MEQGGGCHLLLTVGLQRDGLVVLHVLLSLLLTVTFGHEELDVKLSPSYVSCNSNMKYLCTDKNVQQLQKKSYSVGMIPGFYDIALSNVIISEKKVSQVGGKCDR